MRWSGYSFTALTQENWTLPFVSNGRPAYIRMVVTSTGVGKFGYVGFGPTGVLATVDLIDSAIGFTGTDGKEIEVTVQLPPGVLQLYWISSVTAVYTVSMAIVQEAY